MIIPTTAVVILASTGFVLYRYKQPRFLISVIVAIMILSHSIFADVIQYLDGLMYYSTDAISNIVAIAIITNLQPKTRLVIDVSKILFLMVCANAYGWAIYELFMLPASYNAIMAFLYILLAIRIFFKMERDRNDRRAENFIWSPLVHNNHSQGRHRNTEV